MWNIFTEELREESSPLGSPPHVLQQFYVAMIRSILLYAFPSWCNLGDGLKDKLRSIEKRVLRMIPQGSLPPLFEVGEMTAKSLMREVDEIENHPLNITIVRHSTTHTRTSTTVSSHWAKTTRFKNSFTSFADCLG
jgi:hypothetical protein